MTIHVKNGKIYPVFELHTAEIKKELIKIQKQS